MTSLFRSRLASRSATGLDLQEWVNFFQYGGLSYPFQISSTLGGTTEEITGDFAGLVEAAYKRNGIVFACMLVRQLLFSEARFQFRGRSGGRPGELFGTQALRPLEQPSPGKTTGHLLTRMIQDADLAGNWYGVLRRGGRIRRLRPDWVTIVGGSDEDPRSDTEIGDIDVDVIGYLYHPGGRGSGRRPEVLLPEYVAHFAPIPDPTAAFRGMSWLTPVIREVMGDQAMSEHKLRFMDQGATPNVIVTTDIRDPDDFKRWTKLFSEQTEGAANAYKNMYLGAGARAEAVGADLRQVDFKRVQGAGETRIAAAAGVPPIIVGLSEGLEAATYSNYGQARRRLADGTMRPLWREAAGALAPLITVPSGSELWYDDRDIPFLQEDVKDAADIRAVDALSIKGLTEAGYEPETVIKAIKADDMSLLKHTGVFSVQLQPPGADSAAPRSDPRPAAGSTRTGRERLDLLARLFESRAA